VASASEGVCARRARVRVHRRRRPGVVTGGALAHSTQPADGRPTQSGYGHRGRGSGRC